MQTAEKDVSEVELANEQVKNKEYNYKEDPNNPLNWSKWKKYSNFTVVAMNAFIGYFSSAVYMPATGDIMIYFNTNLTTINATIALFLLMNAIAPLFWAPLSEKIGRRWVYITAMALYTVCTIICGISTSLGLFFAFRILQAIFACVGQAVGGGTVSDIFEAHERGKAMSLYILGTILGPAIAPMIGGYIDQYLGWRWIFYIKTILGGILTILNIIFVKETLYRPNQSVLPPPKNFSERLQRLKFNPFGSLGLLTHPVVLCVCIPTSVSFGWFYLLVTILPKTIGSIYHFSTGSIGLCYLAGGIGNVSGSIMSGLISDGLYAKRVAKNDGNIVKEYRLIPMFIGVPFIVTGSLLYGWLLHARVFWIGPLAGYLLSTFGIMFTITVASTYFVDCYTHRSASVMSANNFTRNIMGMMFSLLAGTIRDSMGDGWTYTLMSIICLLCYVVFIPLTIKYGTKWRAAEK
ncbi:MFS general substrate transporter [Backusella circina FSU 941]|nr:MFS general substrate transporter [Backusella circina FSU 941]